MSKKNTPSEEDFDDLDFDDIDPDEGFDDESWDDFDDSDNESVAPDDVLGDGDVENKGLDAPSRKKSFLQKNFNLIVIAVAVIGGGGFIFTQMGGSSKTVQSPLEDVGVAEALPQEIPELSDNMPPVPAPIENTANGDMTESFDTDLDIALQELPADSEALPVDTLDQLAESADVLTPLPDLTDVEVTEFADLDIQGQNEIPEINDTEELSLDLAAQNDVSAFEDGVISDPEIELTVSEPLDDFAADSEEDFSGSLSEQALSIVESTDAIAEEIPAPNENISTLEAEIQSLNEALSKSKSDLNIAEKTENRLSQDLQAANSKIQSLDAEVSALREELKTLKNSKKAAETQIDSPQTTSTQTVSEAVSQNQTAETPVVSAPQPSEKPVTAPSETAADTANQSWVLKSASPGHAVLSPQDGSDMRQVEVGDRVPGLGKVLSISLEDNLWVVRGESGVVSQ